MRAIFQKIAVPLHKNLFSENFRPEWGILVSADMDF